MSIIVTLKKWLILNSVQLNEEWGLVDYIFRDKTGILTCNKMEFKYCIIGDICYQYKRGNPKENSEKEILETKKILHLLQIIKCIDLFMIILILIIMEKKF